MLSFFNSTTTDESYENLNSLRKCTIAYLEKHLSQKLYPAYLLIKLLPTQISQDICYNVLLTQADQLQHTNNETLLHRFITILSNTDWSEKILLDIRQHIFPLLALQVDDNDDLEWFCWLSSQHSKTLSAFLCYQGDRYLADQHWKQLTVKLIFILATVKQHHFLKYVLSQDQCSVPSTLQGSLSIVRQLQSVESENAFEIKPVEPTTLAHHLIYEMKRINRLCALIKMHDIDIKPGQLASKYNIIDLLQKNLNLATVNYDLVHSLLIDNEEINLKLPRDTNYETSEIELYDQFMILHILLELIVGNEEQRLEPMTMQIKLKEIRKLLRNMKTFGAFVKVIEFCYVLIFLRWDHIDDRTHLNRTIGSGSESDGTTKLLARKYEKYGFLCGMDTLELILNTLKSAVTQKKHSDEFLNYPDNHHKQTFARLTDQINDAIWRLSLFKGKQSYDIRRSTFDAKKLLAQHPLNTTPKSSSDDEDGEKKLIVADDGGAGCAMDKVQQSRRKPRKRNPFRKIDGEKNVSFSHSTENEKEMQSSGGISFTGANNYGSEKRCIINKMIGSSEHLTAVSMNKGDLNVTRQIIKVSHSLSKFSISSVSKRFIVSSSL